MSTLGSRDHMSVEEVGEPASAFTAILYYKKNGI
jgi:hypothetical protein